MKALIFENTGLFEQLKAYLERTVDQLLEDSLKLTIIHVTNFKTGDEIPEMDLIIMDEEYLKVESIAAAVLTQTSIGSIIICQPDSDLSERHHLSSLETIRLIKLIGGNRHTVPFAAFNLAVRELYDLRSQEEEHLYVHQGGDRFVLSTTA